MPFWAYYTLSDFRWFLGRDFCKAWLAADFTLCLESVLMILTLSYDRLLLIRYGHRYEIKVTMRSAIVKIVITWTVAFLLYGPAVIGWDIWFDCSILEKYVCDVEFAHNSAFTMTTAIIEFFLPIKGLLIINGLLYCKIRRLMVKTVKDENETEGLTGDDTLDTLTDQNDLTLSTSLKESTNPPSNETQDASRTNGKETKTEQKVSIETNNKAVIDEHKTAPIAKLKEGKNKEIIRTDEKANQHNNEASLNVDISKSVDNENEETKRNNEEGIEKDDTNIAVIGVDEDEKHYVDGGTPLNEEGERKDHVAKTHVRPKSDTTETEPSDLLISVLGVMEKHGSCILTTTDLGSGEESSSKKDTSKVDEDAMPEASSANNQEEGLDTTKPRNEITNTLKRKISSYASRVLHARQSIESVRLEKLKEENLSVQRANNTEKDTYEERDIDLAIREHQASHSVLSKRKESTQSNVSSRIRRNTKAARFLAMLVFVFFVCWAPYTIATIRYNC